MISSRDFLTLAENWSRGRTEAEWRCAVSRAYYASFHECRQFLQVLGFAVPRADLAHAFLWRRLENSGVASLTSIGKDLGWLRSERNLADYDLHKTISQPTALRAVAAAFAMLDALRQLNENESRHATEAMKNYERDVLRESTWRTRPR